MIFLKYILYDNVNKSGKNKLLQPYVEVAEQYSVQWYESIT